MPDRRIALKSLFIGVALALSACGDRAAAPAREDQNVQLQATDTGYVESNGIRVYYETYGEGEPLVVLHGGLMDIRSMAPVIAPLADNRRVIAIDLQGHGRTELGDQPIRHERLADDVAAVLRHLNIAQADIAGYSFGGDAAMRVAIQHPEIVRRLIVISTAYALDGWYPEVQAGMASVSDAAAPMMEGSPPHRTYIAVAPHPDQFPALLDAMGELMKQDYDWSAELRATQTPVLLVFADHDAISMEHISRFFALFGGGVRDAGWQNPQFSRARLVIIPGYTHYNFTQGPDVARAIEAYLNEPTVAATSAAP